MKTLIVSGMLIGTLGFLGYTELVLPCSSPIQYSIGTFDTKFGLSQADFQKDIEAGATIWEQTFNKNFFEYNPEAKFKINLIYDSRQQEVDAKQKTEFGLSKAEDDFKSQEAIFAQIKNQYQTLVSTHEVNVAAFDLDSKKYQGEVESFNAKGGAGKSDYERLETIRKALNDQAKGLNTEAASINALSSQVNTALTVRNGKAEEYNRIAASYNEKYSANLEFNQAEYVSKDPVSKSPEINVYEFKNTKDLTVALSHELGHALGLDHVSNSKSIMYYLMGDQDLMPTAEDKAEISRVCRF